MVNQDKMAWYEWSRMYQKSQEVADELHAEGKAKQGKITVTTGS